MTTPLSERPLNISFKRAREEDDTSASKRPRASINDQLCDDALRTVFQWVDIRDYLAAEGVCQKWYEYFHLEVVEMRKALENASVSEFKKLSLVYPRKMVEAAWKAREVVHATFRIVGEAPHAFTAGQREVVEQQLGIEVARGAILWHIEINVGGDLSAVNIEGDCCPRGAIVVSFLFHQTVLRAIQKGCVKIFDIGSAYEDKEIVLAPDSTVAASVAAFFRSRAYFLPYLCNRSRRREEDVAQEREYFSSLVLPRIFFEEAGIRPSPVHTLTATTPVGGSPTPSTPPRQ